MTSVASPDALRVWFRLIRLESRIRGSIAERLRGVDLSVPQCDVLTTLSESEGVSQQDLAERLYVTKGNISGLVDRLAAAGLVERRDLPSDRRSHAIYLTASGRKAAERGVAIQRSFVEETLGRMSADDLAAFEAHLVKARDLVREATAGPSRKEAVKAKPPSKPSSKPLSKPPSKALSKPPSKPLAKPLAKAAPRPAAKAASESAVGPSRADKPAS